MSAGSPMLAMGAAAATSEISAVTQESLSGVRVVRAYGQEESELAKFHAANEEYIRRNRGLIMLRPRQHRRGLGIGFDLCRLGRVDRRCLPWLGPCRDRATPGSSPPPARR